MRTRSKLLLAALTATALLGIAVQSASANRLSIQESERGFRAAWTSLTLTAGGRSVSCPVTLEGSLQIATLNKRAGTSLGRVTGAAVGTCTRNSMTILRETLPWEVQYSSFGGTLPNITSVTLNVLGLSFQVNLEGIICLARTSASQPARYIAELSSGRFTSLRADESATIETGGGLFCALFSPPSFSGTATVTSREGREPVTFQLIGPILTPSPVSFGTVEPSSITERTVTIESGPTETTVNEIGLTTGTHYSISDPSSCRGARLAANTTCSFVVTFRAPAELGTSTSDTVNVGTSLGRLTDAVSGSTPQPPSASPSPIEFGRLATRTLARREVTITSGVAATIESIRVRTGTNFSITDPNRCVGTRLLANGRCTFNVIVETPAETGRLLEDTVLIGTSVNTIEDVARAST